MKILKFKVNTRKSIIPKFIKFPKIIYPEFPMDKKPNPLLIEKIDLEKSVFLFKVDIFDKDSFIFERIDKYPFIWTKNTANFLYPVKKGDKYPDMMTYRMSDFKYPLKSDHKFYGISDCDLFPAFDKPFCHYIKTYHVDKKIFTNEILYYAIKKAGGIKLCGKSFIHMDQQ